jgi:hypothetical protein
MMMNWASPCLDLAADDVVDLVLQRPEPLLPRRDRVYIVPVLGEHFIKNAADVVFVLHDEEPGGKVSCRFSLTRAAAG